MTDTNAPSGLTLDLNTLAPKAAEIDYKDKKFSVPPLDIPDFARLMDLKEQFSKINEVDIMKKDVIIPVYTAIKEFVNGLIPELEKERLTLQQLMVILNFINAVNTPDDKALAELKARGIEVTKEEPSDPKDLSTLSEPLLNSSESTKDTESNISQTAQ